MRVLLWVVALVPLAVFGVVASNVGRRTGCSVFQSLVWFIVVVLAGLACQVTWYLVQMAVFARMSPLRFLRGATDVMATTFSTASTGATMPDHPQGPDGPLGVSRASSQLAACVGTNFNNDGTALYQAAVVLFMAQAMGTTLTLDRSDCRRPDDGRRQHRGGLHPVGRFVTLPLIFAAVGLPADKIPIILTIDWFLDRCRTTSNVLGDMTVAVLLDRTAGPAASAGAGRSRKTRPAFLDSRRRRPRRGRRRSGPPSRRSPWSARFSSDGRTGPTDRGGRRRARRRGEPVHLAEVVDRPVRQGRAEPERRLDRDQAVVRPFEVGKHLVKRLQAASRPGRPSGRPRRRSRGRPVGAKPVAVDRAGGAAGHVEEPAVLDPHRPQEPVDRPDPEPGEVGERRAEVRRPDRRQAQDPARPGRDRPAAAGRRAPPCCARSRGPARPGRRRSICSASTRARSLTPAIGGTRVTTTRFPPARRNSGIPRKYEVNVSRPRPIRS